MAIFSLQALHDEIESDPTTIGYKEPDGTWKSDLIIAHQFHHLPYGDIIQRSTLQPQEIIEQIEIVDFRALAAPDRLYLQLLPSLNSVSAVQNTTQLRANLVDIFAGTPTLTNLIAIVQRQGSRAEVLWGENTLISPEQIEAAADL